MEEKQARIEQLRQRFDELSEQLRKIRREWLVAHDRRDVERETALVDEETNAFHEVSKVISEFTKLMKGAER